VKRLSDKHSVHAPGLDRNRLGAACQDGARVDQRPHPVVRLDRDDSCESLRELSCEPPRSGTEVENACSGPQFERFLSAVEERCEVGRPDAVIGLGDVPEGEAERTRFVQRPASTSGPRNG
jgi:hypothetical protein